MITNPDFVTRKALERFRDRRRPFVFKDRTGQILHLGHVTGAYSVLNVHTRRVFVFHTLPDLRRHLKESA